MEDLLKNIPENLRDKCIVKDGVIYCPETDIDGNILRTAQDIIDGTNIKEVKATEQQVLNAQLLQQNAEMQTQLEQQKQLNAQMLLQIASLGGSANV